MWLRHSARQRIPQQTVTALVVVAVCVLCPPAQAQESWFGWDKAAHLGAGVALSTAGYAVGTYAFDSRWAGVALGTGSALAAAGLKEGLDAAGLGQPSYRDFVWSVVGTGLGIGLSVTFDFALRGPLPATHSR